MFLSRIVLIGLLTTPCFAQDWSREDTYRQTALTALLISDWAQTRWIVKHPQDPTRPDGTYDWRAEGNSLLGSHPTLGRVNNYFALSILGHATISYLLPPTWRHGWQYVWIGVEVNEVNHNRRMGIKMDF